MKVVPFSISAFSTIVLVVLLNTQFSARKTKTPRLGYFLSPQYGFWQNAEPTNESYDADIKITGVKKLVDVYFDDRLVPHIYAENDADAYFMQGYLHAKFRLWQMEFQTHVAAGRLSEVIGQDGVKTDRYFRRLGMVFGAEQALKEMESDTLLRQSMDSYTAGVNAYVKTLKPEDLPFEYKLLNYAPEPWTNMKTALFLKFMSWDLSGQGDDLTYTNARNHFGYEDYMKLFPAIQDSLDPIIPRGTLFDTASIKVQTPLLSDSLYLQKISTASVENVPPMQPNKNNGSNNWAVAGSKTKSGKPILCNDPHLGLNLPSLWFEMQITTPSYSTYGATFPGSPTVIIGFNDSCAWGVTNSGRDVKDYYELKFKDSTLQEYWFNGAWMPTSFRKEVIKVKGQADIEEKIAVTNFGLVMYDKSYPSTTGDEKYIAVKWKAHEPSNELKTFYLLNRMKNYYDYADAVLNFKCPGQNFVFASHSGDIAIRQQGAFVAKWKQQGDFVMPGYDSRYMWQGTIPANENPQMLNPARGFVSSANQQAVDDTYPYYLGRPGNFPPYRGLIINRKLAALNNITPEDMQMLQTNNYNVFAEIARPVLLKYLQTAALNSTESKYLEFFKNWNLNNDVAEKGATVFRIWWDSLEVETWADEYAQTKLPMPWPDESTLIESLAKDSAYKFADNIRTLDKIETIADIVLSAFQKAAKTLSALEKNNQLDWAKFKDTQVQHLLKLPALSNLHLSIGGGQHIINATTSQHGPSWRMIVHMTDQIEAFGVYPGGQSGNPGSKYYDNFVQQWASGRYYTLIFESKMAARKDNRLKWHMSFIPA